MERPARVATLLAAALVTLVDVLAGGVRAGAERRTDAQSGWHETSPGFVVPDDPLLREQWWLFNFGQRIGGRVDAKAGADLRAPEAWSVTTGSPEVVVAVLDGGIDYDHPEFAGQIWTNPGETGSGRESNGRDDDGNGYADDWRGWDFVADDNDPLDENGHGTRVAGVVAAKGADAVGITGIAPGVKLMPLRVADPGVDFGVTPKAIDYAARMGARVVVQSYTSEPSGLFDRSQAETAAMLAHSELLFVTGAGNDGNDYRGFEGRAGGLKPCNNPTVPNLICVAGTDRLDQAWEESTFGIGRVHLAAPAESMLVATRPREVAADDHFPGAGSWAPASDMLGFWAPEGPAPTFAFETDATAEDGRVLHVTNSPPAGGTSTGVIRLGEPLDVTGRTGCELSVNVAGTMTGASSVDLGLFRQADQRRNAFGGALTITPNDLGDAGDEFVPLRVPLRAHESLELAIRAQTRAGAPGTIDLRIDGWEVECWKSEHGDRDYEYWAGTSFSTPLVAGVAALVASAQPALDAMQIRQAILESVVELPSLQGLVQTSGRLDAFRALQRAAAIAGSGPPGVTPGSESSSSRGASGGDAAGEPISFAPHGDYQIPGVGATVGIPSGRGQPDPAGVPGAPTGAGDAAAPADDRGDSGGSSSSAPDSGGTGIWVLGALALLVAVGVAFAGRSLGWFGTRGAGTPAIPADLTPTEYRLSAKEIDQIRTGDEAGRAQDRILGAGKDFALDQLTGEAIKHFVGGGLAVAYDVASGAAKAAGTLGLGWTLANIPDHSDQRDYIETMIRDGEIGKLEKAHLEMASYDLDETETGAWLNKLSDLAHSQEAAENLARQRQAFEQLNHDAAEANKAMNDIKDSQARFESDHD